MSEGLTREAALHLMIVALAKGEDRQFHIGIVGYFIEGIPYTADGLTVSADRIPNLVETHNGFACDALSRRVFSMSPPSMPEASSPCGMGLKPCRCDWT